MNRRSIVGIAAIIILIVILCIVIFSMRKTSNEENTDNMSADDKITGYTYEQDHIMHSMMDSMNNIEYSGIADIDFLRGMIPHHKSAIEMAECYIKYGPENSDMKKLAENIIATQTDEIDEMNKMENGISNNNKNSENSKKYIEEYVEMMKKGHSHNYNFDSIDKAFAEGMAEHHQMAVDMAESIIKYGEDEGVIMLAKNIVKTQTEEIDEMNKLINQ